MKLVSLSYYLNVFFRLEKGEPVLSVHAAGTALVNISLLIVCEKFNVKEPLSNFLTGVYIFKSNPPPGGMMFFEDLEKKLEGKFFHPFSYCLPNNFFPLKKYLYSPKNNLNSRIQRTKPLNISNFWG